MSATAERALEAITRERFKAEVAAWADRIRGQAWSEAYAFLKHEEDSPAGPDAAVKLAAMVGEG